MEKSNIISGWKGKKQMARQKENANPIYDGHLEERQAEAERILKEYCGK